MKITVERLEILQALQKVIGAIEKKQTLSILTNVLIENNKENRIFLTCTDLEIQIVSQCHCIEVENLDSMLLPAKKFFDIVKSFEDNSLINLSFVQEKVKISSGSSEYRLSTQNHYEFPKITKSNREGYFQISRISFQNAIQKVIFAVADQDIRYYLNGILIDVKQEDGTLSFVGTDGHRLSLTKTIAEEIKVDGNLQRKRLLLPKKAANELVRLLEKNLEKKDIITVNIHQNHISFHSEEFLFISKLIEGEFPSYEKLLRKTDFSLLTVSRKELLKVLNKALVISDERNKSMTWHIYNNTLKIEVFSENQDFTDHLNIDAEKSEKIAFNIRYIKEFLELAEDDTILMRFSDNNNSSLLTEKEENYQYLVMPVKV
jgi:DNA polymerase-3 subunit beta